MTEAGLQDVVDCRDIEGINCDAAGRVSQLSLATAGLRGDLPESVASLPGLTRVALENNRLTGNVPVFTSSKLEVLRLSTNDFEGDVPCPNSAKFLEFTAHGNALTGGIPSCLLNSPTLRILDLSHNPLGGSLPSVHVETPLAVLWVAQAGLVGGLGPVANLTSLGRLDLSRNFLDGPLEERLLARLPKLYELDLNWNRLSGTVPNLPDAPGLRRVELGHNRFSGELDHQFDKFAANQDHGVISYLTLDDNEFCGVLPQVFYDLLFDSRYVLTGGGRNPLEVGGNHFRCAGEAGNLFFEDWARQTGHDFGECARAERRSLPVGPEFCYVLQEDDARSPTPQEGAARAAESRGRTPAGTPIALPSSVAPADGHPVVMPGNDLSIAGTFVKTTGGTCRFRSKGGRRVEAPGPRGTPGHPQISPKLRQDVQCVLDAAVTFGPHAGPGIFRVVPNDALPPPGRLAVRGDDGASGAFLRRLLRAGDARRRVRRGLVRGRQRDRRAVARAVARPDGVLPDGGSQF